MERHASHSGHLPSSGRALFKIGGTAASAHQPSASTKLAASQTARSVLNAERALANAPATLGFGDDGWDEF